MNDSGSSTKRCTVNSAREFPPWTQKFALKSTEKALFSPNFPYKIHRKSACRIEPQAMWDAARLFESPSAAGLGLSTPLSNCSTSRPNERFHNRKTAWIARQGNFLHLGSRLKPFIHYIYREEVQLRMEIFDLVFFFHQKYNLATGPTKKFFHSQPRQVESPNLTHTFSIAWATF